MLNLKEKDKQQHLLAGIIVAGFLYPIIGHFAVVATIAVGQARISHQAASQRKD